MLPHEKTVAPETRLLRHNDTGPVLVPLPRCQTVLEGIVGGEPGECAEIEGRDADRCSCARGRRRYRTGKAARVSHRPALAYASACDAEFTKSP